MKLKSSYKIIYLFLTLIIMVMFSPEIFAQISPGELTFAHAKLEGLSNCTKCHVLGKGVRESKCLSCHTEIQKLISTGNGYHANSGVKNKKCWNCHSEHHGRDFQIIHFSVDNYDHNKTGFKLKGKHSQLKCEECHQYKFITNSLFKKRKNTYLGLKTNCESCHEDVHQGTLGKDCGSCHNLVNFKPAVYFNHDQTKFKLAGAHKKVECIKCHKTEILKGKNFQKFTGLDFRNCTPCHRDIHKGRFGQNCTNCHNDISFKLVNKRSFNHDETGFALKGAHKHVVCSDCHGNNLMSKLKFAKCTDCHKDEHFGEFTQNNVVKDCKDCHTVKSFKNVLYTIDEHNQLNFKLTGAHLAVTCKSCHLKKESNGKEEWHFKFNDVNCIDCHKNVHGNEISEKFLSGDKCNSCHNTQSWDDISFNHNRTSFMLLGKHKSVSCKNCHEEKTGSGKITFKFISLKSNCITCHNDIHFGQFNSDKVKDKFICENCHGFNNWKPVKFDHEKTNFPLKGAHDKVPCLDCHKNVNKSGNKFIKYKMVDFKCASCHA